MCCKLVKDATEFTQMVVVFESPNVTKSDAADST